MSTTFTIENLIEAYDLIYPPIHFVTSKFLDEGKIYLIKGHTIGFLKYPRCIFFHPSFLQEVSISVPMRLIPLSELEPEYKFIKLDEKEDGGYLYDLFLRDAIINKNDLSGSACS